MYTGDSDHHPLAQRFPFLRSEDTTIATLASWTVGIVIWTLAGFYLGTVAGHDNHPEGRHKDLDPTQLAAAIPYALSGLALGIVFALLITFWYTPVKLRELDREHVAH